MGAGLARICQVFGSVSHESLSSSGLGIRFARLPAAVPPAGPFIRDVAKGFSMVRVPPLSLLVELLSGCGWGGREAPACARITTP